MSSQKFVITIRIEYDRLLQAGEQGPQDAAFSDSGHFQRDSAALRRLLDQHAYTVSVRQTAVSDEDWRRQVVSVHEAGHAVAGVLLGGSMEHVELAPKPQCACRFPLEDPSAFNGARDAQRADHYRRISLKAVAGMAAERLVFNHESIGGRQDTDTAARAVRKMWELGGRRRSDLMRHIAVMTRLLRSPQAIAAINHLASELQEKERLLGSEVHEIVRGHMADNALVNAPDV
jgi:hypothetical protein